MLDKIKKRCGIAVRITTHDDEVKDYIADCVQDMIASGVPAQIALAEDDERVLTAITCYVKAYIGDDRSDTEKYLSLYQKKVFRLALEGDEDVE